MNTRHIVASLVLVALAFVCPQAFGDVLVRNCDTPTAMGCAVAPIWVAPPKAINVQVQRSGAPFVRLGDIQPSERIATCYNDPAIQDGSTTKCSTTVPNRTDLWELKATLYPPDVVLGQITLTWDPVTVSSTGADFDGTVAYIVSRQQDVCGADSVDPRCGTMPWISEDVGPVSRKIFANLAGRWCFRVQGRTAAGDLGVISVPDEDDCALAIPRVLLPGPVLNIKATAP